MSIAEAVKFANASIYGKENARSYSKWYRERARKIRKLYGIKGRTVWDQITRSVKK